MTDAEKLREISRSMQAGDDICRPAQAQEYRDSQADNIKALCRIADLLDAVPPETLAALKAGTWKAVPVVMPDDMKRKVGGWGPNLDLIWKELLFAAPAKPKG